MGTKPPAGRSFRHGIAVTPPSKREAVESGRPRGQGLEVKSSRKIEKYYFSLFARLRAPFTHQHFTAKHRIADAPKGALGNPYSLHSEATKLMQPRP